jgi:hypothetical protein
MAKLQTISTVLSLATAITGGLFSNKETAEVAKNKVTTMVADGTLTPHIESVISAVKDEVGPPKANLSNTWRPTGGWVAVVTSVYAGILQPLLAWYCAVKGLPPPPSINLEVLGAVAGLGGVLGIARSYDKANGSAP